MTDVPAVNPVKRPLLAPIAAIPGIELVHVPPDVVDVHVSEDPTHRGVVPVIV